MQASILAYKAESFVHNLCVEAPLHKEQVDRTAVQHLETAFLAASYVIHVYPRKGLEINLPVVDYNVPNLIVEQLFGAGGGYRMVGQAPVAQLFEPAEFSEGPDENPPVCVNGNRADICPCGHMDQIPGISIKFEQTGVVCKIHDSILVLGNVPVLSARTMIRRGPVSYERGKYGCRLSRAAYKQKGQKQR